MLTRHNIDLNKDFFSSAELAALLGVSRIAIFKKIQNHQIKAKKVGRNYIISKEEIAIALGEFVPEKRKKEIDIAVERTVREYGKALRRLGKE